jgi:hypothetical protein
MSAKNRLIVCERTGRWATALRREFRSPLIQTRSLSQCWNELSAMGGGFGMGFGMGFIVVELSQSNADDLLRRMGRLQRDFPLVKVAIVAPRSMADHQWLMREAGAVHFVCSTRRLGPLALLAKRHLASLPEAVQTPEQRIWDSLPWQSR